MLGRIQFTRRGAALFACLSLGAAPLFAQETETRRTKEAYVGKRKFEIPVVLTKAPDQIRTLHLWMSPDQGKSWDVLRSVPPTRKSFTFDAPTDGEYQFTLAHEKLDGTKSPADVKNRPAGMRVIVDTVKPDVQLRPTRHAAEQTIGVTWTIDDANPDLKTFSLKLRTSKDPTWHELKANQAIEGKMEWPTDAGDDYTVKVSLADRAGNEGSKTLDIPGFGSEPTGRRSPPIAAKMGTLDEPQKPMAKPTGDLDDLLEPPAPKLTKKAERPEFADIPAVKAPTKMEPSFPESPKMDRSRSATIPTSSSAATSFEPKTPNVFDPSRIDMPPQRPVGEEDVIASRSAPRSKSDESGVRQVGLHEAMKPPVEEPKIKLVGSPRFRMKYSLSGVGPSGVGAVDLYMTKDNGGSWSRIGDDPDLESPIDVNLPGDGSYGLTVVVSNKAKGGQRPPRPGEQPQIRVHVDTEAPFAKLTQVAPDPASPRESMSLAWETEDAHPAERCVDIYFSHDPERGWYKIAAGLPKSGVHSWKVPAGVPFQVYFMLMARDQAGNVEKIYSNNPVTVDLSNPHGKIDAIVDVLPLKKSADE